MSTEELFLRGLVLLACAVILGVITYSIVTIIRENIQFKRDIRAIKERKRSVREMCERTWE